MVQQIQVIPALSLAPYTAKDNVGGLLTFEIAGNFEHMIVKRVQIIDNEQQNEPFNLHLFSGNPSATVDTDADEYLPAAADIAMHLCTIVIVAGDYVDSSAENYAEVEVNRYVQLVDYSKFYGILEAVATPDYAIATDLTLNITITR